MALMASGKLHRCGELGGQPSEVSALEAEFAAELGLRYCVALNACGSAMFVALKAAGVMPGDAVLSNCFTLAPVPGAIAHAQARPLRVDVTDDYTIDLADLERKAQASGAKTLLLSHMRGHIVDMPALMAICRRHGVQAIEDCAHTMGAGWAGRATGTWGRAGCFSLHSCKHANAGEGSLLATDDADIAAPVNNAQVRPWQSSRLSAGRDPYAVVHAVQAPRTVWPLPPERDHAGPSRISACPQR